MDTNDELFLVLDDTMDEEYGKKEPPKTKEVEKVLAEYKRRLKNGHYDLNQDGI